MDTYGSFAERTLEESKASAKHAEIKKSEMYMIETPPVHLLHEEDVMPMSSKNNDLSRRAEGHSQTRAYKLSHGDKGVYDKSNQSYGHLALQFPPTDANSRRCLLDQLVTDSKFSRHQMMQDKQKMNQQRYRSKYVQAAADRSHPSSPSGRYSKD